MKYCLLPVVLLVAGCTAVQTIPDARIFTSVVDADTSAPIAGAKFYAMLGSPWGSRTLGPWISDADGKVVIIFKKEDIVVSRTEFLDNDSRFSPTFYCEAEGYRQSGFLFGPQSMEAVAVGFMTPWKLTSDKLTNMKIPLRLRPSGKPNQSPEPPLSAAH